MPTSLSPCSTGVPGAGNSPSTRTGTSRRLTSPRYLRPRRQLLAHVAALGPGRSPCSSSNPTSSSTVFSASRSRDSVRQPQRQPMHGPNRPASHRSPRDLRQHPPARLRQPRIRRLRPRPAAAPRPTPRSTPQVRRARRHLGPQPEARQPLHQHLRLAASQSSSSRSPSAKMKKSASHLPCGVSSAAHTAGPAPPPPRRSTPAPAGRPRDPRR